MDKNKKEIYILVYQLERDGYIYPKCRESIKLDMKLIENICLSNHDINDNLIGIKVQIEDIINDYKQSIILIIN